MNADPKRILLIKPSSLGDVVHALPVLNLLKRRWPQAQISWLVTPACAGLIESHPQLHETIVFERRRLGAFWRNPRAAAGLMRLTKELRQRQFDLALDLQGLLRSGWLAWRSGAPRRVGLSDSRELAWLFHNQRVVIDKPDLHAVDRYLAAAEALGCGRQPVEFLLPQRQADRQSVEAMLPPERFAVLLPAANWLTKRWPVERYAALVEPLRQRFGLSSVVAGGADAVELAREIPGALSLAGKTTLGQLVELLRRADLVVANDTGPMHIAAALGRPLVAVFGPTNPQRTGPYGRPECVVKVEVPCAPCYRRRCWHRSCLEWLGIEPVLAAAERQLAGAGAGQLQ